MGSATIRTALQRTTLIGITVPNAASPITLTGNTATRRHAGIMRPSNIRQLESPSLQTVSRHIEDLPSI